ncbi:sigma-54-dependent Fis family transcriptional regulator [Vibrio harveyi]|nr:sigma-54-dependent Fis family transcriptional regulator [Vibrio harveyi]
MKKKYNVLMLKSIDAEGVPDFSLMSDIYTLHIEENFRSFLASLSQHSWDMVLLPIEDAYEGSPLVDVLKSSLLRLFSGTIVVMAAFHHADEVSQCLQAGAHDYLLYPFESFHLTQLISRVDMASQHMQEMVVTSSLSQQLFQMAQRVALTDASILITGESGSGKEVLAQFIHHASMRCDGPFVAVNCAALPETMIESILFGHAKGAFTGATNTVLGKLELANGGTLLLDEVGELPLALQAKLLRALQERYVERLGCNKKRTLDIRVIAATNLNLEQAVSHGTFRSDLYYRLNVFPLKCIPLRERKEDILPLAYRFIKHYLPDFYQKIDFSEDAKQQLLGYGWPGNVRELENIIQRALVLSRGSVIRAQDLMLQEVKEKLRPTTLTQAVQKASVTSSPNLKKSKKIAEFQTIIETLQQCQGHRINTAKALGVSTRALRYKINMMKENGWDVDEMLTNLAS